MSLQSARVVRNKVDPHPPLPRVSYHQPRRLTGTVPSSMAALEIDFRPTAFDVYGSVGPGSLSKGISASAESHLLLLILSSVVQQQTAIAISRRRLHRHEF